MTLALAMVPAFAAWTLLVLIAGVGVRRWAQLLAGTATLTCFPADVPHGSPAYRRAMRAHANCVENLPVFAAVVLTGAIAQVHTPATDALAIATMAARVGQSVVHVALPETDRTVGLRFAFFFAQVVCMAALVLQTAAGAPATGLSG